MSISTIAAFTKNAATCLASVPPGLPAGLTSSTKNNTAFGSVVGIVESTKGTMWLANTEGGINVGNETAGCDD